MTDFSAPTWSEALREFLLHVEATRASKTLRYFKVQLGQLVIWATAEKVSFDQFGKRHLDRYLIFRQNDGKSPLTLHHDAVCAKAFMIMRRKRSQNPKPYPKEAL